MPKVIVYKILAFLVLGQFMSDCTTLNQNGRKVESESTRIISV